MKSKKGIIISATAIAVCGVGIGIFALNKNNDDNKSTSNVQDISNLKTVKLDEEVKKNIKELNENLDNYYMQNWDNNKFISFYSYFSTYDEVEVEFENIAKDMGYTIPDSLKEVVIHFVKPKSLKPYLNDKISDEDLEILTVYTALPVEDGVYISSKFDEGGVISNEDYKKFVLEHSWEHGEIKTPDKNSEEYKEILSTIGTNYPEVKDGNVKYIACDDKYAIIVISSLQDPSCIREMALQKDENGQYNVIVDELEKVDSRIFVNYAYTDFNLNMLPIYEISSYPNISNDVTPYITAFKESGDLGENEELTYGCTGGNFAYLEFKSGLKMLVHTNVDGVSNIYQVDDYKEAISQMVQLEENPPVFILNFE